LEDAVRECLTRAASALPRRTVDRAGDAVRRARRARRRQAAGGAVAILAVTAVAGGTAAWQAGGSAPPRPSVEIAVDGALVMADGCGRIMRCAG